MQQEENTNALPGGGSAATRFDAVKERRLIQLRVAIAKGTYRISTEELAATLTRTLRCERREPGTR